VIDAKSPQISKLVSTNAAATPGGFIDYNRTRHQSAGAIACLCEIVGAGKNFGQHWITRLPALCCQGSVFCAQPLAQLRTDRADRTGS
jgi:hypothetical protein